MALKIIDALKSGFPHDGSFGRAHLIFDRDIDANPLRVSLLQMLGGEYLGESFPLKANWTPKRSHFFSAKLVSRDGGQTVYVLGPEVSTFIPPESMLEVASEDNSIREVAVWNDVSVDLTWQPSSTPLPTWKPVAPSQPAAPPHSVAPPQPVASPQPIVSPEPVAPQQPVARQSQPETPPDPRTEKPEPPAPIPPPLPPSPPVPAEPTKWGVWAVALVALAVVAGGISAIYWGAYHRDYLCDRFHLFCDPEEVAYREVQTCSAKMTTCGASECVARYRDAYPNGRFRTEVDDIAVAKGRPCNEPPRVDPEKVAYDRVIACSGSRSCGAPECVTEYRQAFPRGAHKTEVERIATACFDATEKAVYDQAVGCARSRACGALECIAEYRRRYPNGTYKAEIDQIAQSPRGQACPDLDREAYDRAVRCAERLSCGADHCLIEYRRDFAATGRYRSEIEEIGRSKGRSCPAPQASPAPDQSAVYVPIRRGDDPGMNCNARNLEPIAQMICKDSDMARANGELQRAFDARVRSVSDAGELRSDERAWIERRDRECGIPPSGSWDINDLRRVKNCFLDKTRARINELRQ